jgi:hypothetical protein
MKPLSAANDNLDQKTRQVWEPRLERDLNPEDVREITANVTGFFGLLAKWARDEPPTPANDPGEPNRLEGDEARDDR